MKVVKSPSVFLLALVTLVPALAYGQQVDNVYVRLYTERVKLAQAEVRREEAETVFQAARLARLRYLLGQNAVSREEFERGEADYKKSVAEVDVLKARVGEEEASLEVVRYLVQNGQPVPLCRQ